MITSTPIKRIWCTFFHRDDEDLQGRFRCYYASPGQDYWVDYYQKRCKVCGCSSYIYDSRFDLK